MNHSAKGFRVASGMTALINLIAFFLPISKQIWDIYPTITTSEFEFMMNGLDAEILFLMLLPVILAVVAGIWSVVGSERQIISAILTLPMTVLYIILVVRMSVIDGHSNYSAGIAGGVHIVASLCSTALAIAAICVTPSEEEEMVLTDIPQLQEIKQQQMEAGYSVVVQTPQYVEGNPRGVMVGLTGIYAGAEIAFANGESIRLGRLPDNDLVFENQDRVSRNHCRIKWDGNNKKYLLFDYSSNGTFVNGSEDCLPQNLEIQVEPGTVLAIGDEQNTFRLE